MSLRYVKDNFWIVGLVAAFLLFANVFIQSKLQTYQDQPDLSSKPIQSKKIIDLTQGLDDSTGEAGFKHSLDLNLELLGTIIGNPSLAFIADLDSDKYRLCKLNQLVAGAKIVSITAGRVIVQRDGLRQILMLGGSQEYVDDNYDRKTTAIAAISPDKMIVSKSGVINQMGKVNMLLAKLRILPVSDSSSDKLKGFRIDNIPSGSIIEQAGVRSGDIICSVQGERIESTHDALRIFSKIKNQSHVQVDLLRAGEPLALSYEIRD